MTKRHYLPKDDLGKAAFLKNLALKLPGYAALFGITPDEVALVVNAAALFNHFMKSQEAFKTFNQANTAYKNIFRDGPVGTPLGALPVFPTLPISPTLCPAGIFTIIGKMMARLKAHPAYTEGMGENLSIVGDEQVIDIYNLKPMLTYRLDGERPLIIWKKGQADSINIYVDRKDGKGFVFLATDSYPDYLDTFPLPDGVVTVVWDYKGIYRIGDETVGQFSELIEVTVTRKIGY